MDEDFPKISVALRIYSTILTTSASCKREYSNQKNVKTYLRSTMCQERSTTLAILTIENQIAFDRNFDEVIKIICGSEGRQVNL